MPHPYLEMSWVWGCGECHCQVLYSSIHGHGLEAVYLRCPFQTDIGDEGPFKPVCMQGLGHNDWNSLQQF